MPIATNAPSPLSFQNYLGNDQNIHPSVVDAHEVLGGTTNWNGHRYWMAYTPYPNGNDREENPCIAVSSDGQNWSTPVGLTNPLAPAPTDVDKFNSDTDILLEPDGSLLHVIYREAGVQTGNKLERIFLVSSSDGISWSAPVELFNSGDSDQSRLLISPSLLKLGSTYYIYTLAFDAGLMGYRSATNIAGPWSSETRLDPGFNAIYSTPWHLDVRLEPNGTLRFIALFNREGTELSSLWIGDAAAVGEPPTNMVLLLNENTGAWDNHLYRACIFPLAADGDYALIYSAYSSDNQWRMGYTTFSLALPTRRVTSDDPDTTVPGVNATKSYEVRSRALIGGKPGGWSGWQGVPSADAPPVPEPKKPQSDPPTAITANSATLNWSVT